MINSSIVFRLWVVASSLRWARRFFGLQPGQHSLLELTARRDHTIRTESMNEFLEVTCVDDIKGKIATDQETWQSGVDWPEFIFAGLSWWSSVSVDVFVDNFYRGLIDSLDWRWCFFHELLLGNKHQSRLRLWCFILWLRCLLCWFLHWNYCEVTSSICQRATALPVVCHSNQRRVLQDVETLLALCKTLSFVAFNFLKWKVCPSLKTRI